MTTRCPYLLFFGAAAGGDTGLCSFGRSGLPSRDVVHTPDKHLGNGISGAEFAAVDGDGQNVGWTVTIGLGLVEGGGQSWPGGVGEDLLGVLWEGPADEGGVAVDGLGCRGALGEVVQG